MKYNPRGFHHEGIGHNPYGVFCGECGAKTCVGCKSNNIKAYIISGIIVHPNDTPEGISPTYMKGRTENEAIREVEKVYNGTLRDIKITQIH